MRAPVESATFAADDEAPVGEEYHVSVSLRTNGTLDLLVQTPRGERLLDIEQEIEAGLWEWRFPVTRAWGFGKGVVEGSFAPAVATNESQPVSFLRTFEVTCPAQCMADAVTRAAEGTATVYQYFTLAFLLLFFFGIGKAAHDYSVRGLSAKCECGCGESVTVKEPRISWWEILKSVGRISVSRNLGVLDLRENEGYIPKAQKERLVALRGAIADLEKAPVVQRKVGREIAYNERHVQRLQRILEKAKAPQRKRDLPLWVTLPIRLFNWINRDSDAREKRRKARLRARADRLMKKAEG